MEKPKWLQWLFIIIVFIAVTTAAIWLSGIVFYLLNKANPFGKTNLLTWLEYWQAYQYEPAIAKKLKTSVFLAFAASYGMFLAATVAALRDSPFLHGNARFATEGEIKKAGLFAEQGIIVGKYKNRFLLFPGMQFVLLAAPTRTGKGVGIVIPNLLSYPESAVVIDVKQENFLITSKYRAQHGQACYLHNPFATDGQTHRYNPFFYVSDNPRIRILDIIGVAHIFYPGYGKDKFFDESARNLFLGIALYLFETPNTPRTIGELLRQGSGKGKPIKEYLQAIVKERNYRKKETTNEAGEKKIEFVPLVEWDGKGQRPLSHECVDALNRFLSTSDNTLSSILASFNAPLTIWASPIVDAATSDNDFDLREVRKTRMTIYLSIPPNKLAEAEILINLFFTQLISLNTDKLIHSTPELKYPCLLLMDEFTAPGRIENIDKANAFLAGYGLRLLTIIQSPSQIKTEPRRGYGREGGETLITNHALKILFTPSDQKTANEYSEMLGTYTFKARSINIHERSKGSESDQRRALMLPQELKEMNLTKQIITLGNTKPILCEKIFYYKDHVFLDRLKSVSPSLAALDNTLSKKRLRKIGINRKAIPSEKAFFSIYGSGELAIDLPQIDFDLHEATVKARNRPLKLADVEHGIDLKKLAIDTSTIVLPDSDNLSEEQIDGVVTNFFDALDSANSEQESEADEDSDEDMYSLVVNKQDADNEYLENSFTNAIEMDDSEETDNDMPLNLNELY